MVAPVRRFLPSHAGPSRVEEVPNPAMVTISLRAGASAMVANSARSADAASNFASDVPAGTFEASFDRFMTGPLADRRWSMFKLCDRARRPRHGGRGIGSKTLFNSRDPFGNREQSGDAHDVADGTLANSPATLLPVSPAL